MQASHRGRRGANARSYSALKHRELNHAVFNLATCQSLASDTLERVPMLVGKPTLSRRSDDAAKAGTPLPRQSYPIGFKV